MSRGLGRFGTVFSLLVLSGWVTASIYYLTSIEYIDHVEPLIASVSWLASLGQPVYHSIDSAERYSNLYGPFLYLFTGGFLKLFGPSILASKIGATMASFASFIFLFFSFPKTARRLDLLAWLALIYLSFAGNLFWIRPEPWLLMFSTLSLLAASRFELKAATFIWALCGVVLVHLKLHGAIYALPSFAIFFQRFGCKSSLTTVGKTAILMVLPFLIIPNLSFQNLMTWIAITSQHGIEGMDIVKNLGWGFFYSLPLLLSSRLREFALKNKPFLTAMALTLMLASISGALRGAGRYHLLPVLPYFVWMGSQVFTKDRLSFNPRFAFGAFAVVALVWNAQRTSFAFYHELKNRDGTEYVADLQTILSQHSKDSIQMGFGHDYPHTFYRPLVVFQQNATLLDPATLMDMTLAKLEFTDATLSRIRECSPSLWIFPKNDEPFDLRHVGDSNLQVLRPELKMTFNEHFEKFESTSHFDLYHCRSRHP